MLQEHLLMPVQNCITKLVFSVLGFFDALLVLMILLFENSNEIVLKLISLLMTSVYLLSKIKFKNFCHRLTLFCQTTLQTESVQIHFS